MAGAVGIPQSPGDSVALLDLRTTGQNLVHIAKSNSQGPSNVTVALHSNQLSIYCSLQSVHL